VKAAELGAVSIHLRDEVTRIQRRNETIGSVLDWMADNGRGCESDEPECSVRPVLFRGGTGDNTERGKGNGRQRSYRGVRLKWEDPIFM
jgi:hypothetical protein